MGLLLDTNVLIPVVDDRLDLLPRDIRAEVEHGADDKIVSVVSIWEVAIKHRQGKLPLGWPLEEWPTILFTLGIHTLDLEIAHVLNAAHPVPDTKDPFDRMLLAICKIERLRLVTTDRKLVDHPLAWKPAAG
jgi:PIN domain nuclease of toxin-antitoxin system